ncbi:uncharacterized protein LOC127858280 [Dreissena polymorpha]|uniref:G-protein coupled receptors family 1 profile domain-containing protein n=1 Tax=Dreissena polymorpha TaxID=45954 RepID=A0A9D4BXK1_DREPO|nr:uncharacterized protein LOC127858280 [Dreissena polymorpha]KAH3712835.1 hypothetical protein DPMN_072592 [Dreissena polymorpha]
MQNGMLANISKMFITYGPTFEHYERLELYVYIYPVSLLTAFMIIGLIGNCFVLYIFIKQWERNKTSVFIITLAALDVVNCSLIIPVEISVFARPFTYDHDVLCKISRCLSFIVTANYSFVLVTVAYDRYLMVCKPLKRITYGQRYAMRACIGATVLAVVTQWPALVIYGTSTITLPVPKNSTETDDNATEIHYFVQGKTCHVTNYYDEVDKIPKLLFLGFLMGGHVIIFGTLIVMYMVIGNRLFLSSFVDILDNSGHASGLLKLGIVSAITGTAAKGKIPSCSHQTGTFSADPSQSPKKKNTLARAQSADEAEKADVKWRRSLEDHRISIGPLATGNDSERFKYKRSVSTPEEDNVFETSGDKNGVDLVPQSEGLSPALCGSSMNVSMAHTSAPHRQAKPGGDLKELSLKKNTLIMRMVTFMFILSYLPYLILVMLRYVDGDIPKKLPTNLKILYHVFLKSYFLNSVSRPFIYIAMNEQYRSKLLKLICRWR